MKHTLVNVNKFLRSTHGIIGLIFAFFLFMQGATAILLQFEGPLKETFGRPFVKTISKLHTGEILGSLQVPAGALTGAVLCYMSVTGVFIMISTNWLKKRSRA